MPDYRVDDYGLPWLALAAVWVGAFVGSVVVLEVGARALAAVSGRR